DSSPTSEMPVSALSEPLAPLEPISAPQRLDTLAPGSEPLLGLAPRQLGPRLSREAALASLDLERDLVLARARAGIALAWDTRRLGYANESRNPFELEVVALLGSGRGHATSLVTEAERLLTAATAARARDREQHFDASPLAEIARDFGLDALELDILIAIAAPTLWGETARLYGVLGNDPGRAIVDEMLVSQLLAATTRYEVAAALGPDGALRRHAIVVATGDRPRPFTTLAINPIVAARLRCESVPLPDAVRVQEASTNLDELYVPIEPIGRLLRELARPQSKSVRLAVRGRRASGRRSVLAGIAARANRALGLIDLGALSSPGAPADLRRWLRMASLCGLIPCVVGAPTTEAAARPLVETIAMHAGPVFAVLGLDDASPFPPGHFELVLPPLSAGDRLDHWRRALGLHGLRVADPEQLSSRYRLAPGLVETAVAHVARSAERPTDDVTAELVTAIRQGRDERLARHATRITRLPRWSDVVLPPDVLDSLRELIGRVQHGRRVYEEWGFDAVMTTGRGVTALFDGRPGTGKTMVAGVVARELGLDLYRVDLSRLVSKWIGETEKNLAEIFDAVDDGQAIILFDEADSLFGKRTEVKSSNDRYANLEVNYLLQRIDSFEGIAILTTNFGSAIDPAFRRRVSLRLSFPFPDEDAREQLWRVHLPRQLPIDGELDLAALARRFQLAGGYIRNACLRAAFLAAQEETTLAQRHLERAVQLEYQQVGKISTSGPVD
ncbi:MAG TPA: ATP-binding protein, partial [Kofleriaceae bacterium]